MIIAWLMLKGLRHFQQMGYQLIDYKDGKETLMVFHRSFKGLHLLNIQRQIIFLRSSRLKIWSIH